MDRRDQASYYRYDNIDERRQVVLLPNYETDELVEVPYTLQVCPTCEGRGTHVAPGVDSHGLSSEDFDNDPDFRDDYFSGAYDVPCAECGGKRVVPELTPRTDEQKAVTSDRHSDIEDQLADQRTYMMEMGMHY